MRNKPTSIRAGQTLVMLLIFILIAITIATTSVSVIISNAQGTSGAAQSMEAYYAAEAGIENATLRLLRDINYTGETLQVSATSSVVITVSHDANYTVTARGVSGTFIRTIQTNLDYTDNILRVVSWKEIQQ